MAVEGRVEKGSQQKRGRRTAATEGLERCHSRGDISGVELGTPVSYLKE